MGRTIGRTVEQWDENVRVALLASGSFSLEVGGPNVGWTDKNWVGAIGSLLQEGDYAKLARRATEARMAAAGNVSGELLCWITLTGALGAKRPEFVEIEEGGGFAAWRLE